MPMVRRPGSDFAEVLSAVSKHNTKPLVSTLLSFGDAGGVADDLGGAHRCPPSLVSSPEVAVAALARTSAYAEWRERPEGAVAAMDGVDEDGARALVAEALRASPEGGPLPAGLVERLLEIYGVRVWRTILVTSGDEAVAAAAALGYPSP